MPRTRGKIIYGCHAVRYYYRQSTSIGPNISDEVVHHAFMEGWCRSRGGGGRRGGAGVGGEGRRGVGGELEGGRIWECRGHLPRGRGGDE